MRSPLSILASLDAAENNEAHRSILGQSLGKLKRQSEQPVCGSVANSPPVQSGDVGEIAQPESCQKSQHCQSELAIAPSWDNLRQSRSPLHPLKMPQLAL